MPMPRILPGIENRIREIWAEDPACSGQDVWDRLQLEPIKSPSLRKVQQIVGDAKRNHVPLEPETTMEPWQHEWFDDPVKAKILLSMHHTKNSGGKADSTPLTEREAKWGLRIGHFFDLADRVDAQWLLAIASIYAELERTSLVLNSAMDTNSLDAALLMKSGVLPSSNAADGLNSGVAEDWVDALQRAVPSVSNLREKIELDRKESNPSDGSTPDEPQASSTALVELWEQLDSDLDLIDRQRFNAFSREKANGLSDWNDSKDKAIFDSREQEIQTMANRLYATPEGQAAHQQFIQETDVTPCLQISSTTPE